MIVSLIEQTDLPFCMALRNTCREAFFSTEIITASHQLAWYRGLRDRDNYQFYVIFNDDLQRVGTVSITRHETGNEIGNVCIVPKWQGFGFGTEAVEYLMVPWLPHFARIRQDNKLSQRLFQRLGFQQTDETKWTLPSRGSTC